MLLIIRAFDILMFLDRDQLFKKRNHKQWWIFEFTTKATPCKKNYLQISFTFEFILLSRVLRVYNARGKGLLRFNPSAVYFILLQLYWGWFTRNATDHIYRSTCRREILCLPEGTGLHCSECGKYICIHIRTLIHSACVCVWRNRSSSKKIGYTRL